MRSVARPLVIGLALLLLAPAALAAKPNLDAAAWTAIFGAAADGVVPTFLKDLKKDMTPAEAGAVFKGAEKPSKFGFAKIKVKGVPGVTQMEIYFQKDKQTQVPTHLKSVTLILDGKTMKDAAIYDALIKVLTAKYGPVKKPETVATYQITWSVGKFQTAQVWKIGRNLTFKMSF